MVGITKAPDGVTFAPSGFATLNIEANSGNRCFLCIVQGESVPAARIDFDYQITDGKFTATSVSGPALFDAQRETLVPAEAHPLANGITFSKHFTVTGSIVRDIIQGEWSGDAGFIGTFRLQNTFQAGPYVPDGTIEMDWQGFKSHVSSLLKGRGFGDLLFRGHGSNTWHLSTTLHRINRFDLLRYEGDRVFCFEAIFNG